MSMSSREEELPEVEHSSIIFDEYLKVRKDTLRLKSKVPYPYYTVITKPQAVVILGTSSTGEVLTTQEYRHPVGKFLLSCPGGLLENDEPLFAGAQRELLEETGYEAQSFEEIGSSFPFAGVSDQLTHFVWAKDIQLVKEPELEPSEILTAQLKPMEEVLKLIQSSDALDGIFCTGLLLLQLKAGSPN